MSYAIGQAVPWPVPPDWDRPVRESLAWLTDVLPPSRSGVRQKRQLRLAPRRSFSFEVRADEASRRIADAVRFDHAARIWHLPIYPDVQLLNAPLNDDITEILCRTGGFDFAAPGQAMLWRAPNEFEIVAIDEIDESGLTLVAPTTQAWPKGTRLYPVRYARLQGTPEESHWSDDASQTRVEFLLDEPCDWPARAPAAIYRSKPVLERRPDESDNPKSSYVRLLRRLDEETGPVVDIDLPDMPFRTQEHDWLLSGRSDQAAFRSLAYWLRGRMGSLWVPTLNADLRLVATVGSSATTLTVQWCGYTVFGREQINRRDIRVELFDGTVFYRRVTGSSEAGETEHLTIDTSLGVAITPGTVRVISFMTFSQLANDTVEIEHSTDADGVARCTTRFEALKHDL